MNRFNSLWISVLLVDAPALSADNWALRIYSTTETTSIRRVSLLRDRQYRVAVAFQNTAYNQPPHASFASP